MRYFTQNMPTTPLQQETSHIRMPLDARSMGSARQTGHTPHSRTSRSFIQKARGHYCFISLTQDTMHYFTRNMPQTLQQKAPLTGCLLGKIHGFCPPNRTYPPWPHLRYPLTSKDEDPNKKILARQSCSRVQRTLLFYLAHSEYHEGYLFGAVPPCTTKNTLK